MQVLAVGCDAPTVGSIRLALQPRWPEMELVEVRTRQKALWVLRDLLPDVVFAMLEPAPADLDHLKFIRKVRATSDTLLIVLSRLPSNGELVTLLTAGADEYLSLPINGAVLLATVVALLRRTIRTPDVKRIRVAGGRLTLAPLTYQAYAGEQPLSLAPAEFKLLYHLAREGNRTVACEALQDAVWGERRPHSLCECVQRVQQKLKAALGSDVQILAVARAGYQLTDGTTPPSATGYERIAAADGP